MRIILAIVLGIGVVAWGLVFLADQQMEAYFDAKSNHKELQYN